MFPLHKVHYERTQENSYPSYIFGAFFCTPVPLFFLKKKKKKVSERPGKIRKNWQKRNSVSASKLL